MKRSPLKRGTKPLKRTELKRGTSQLKRSAITKKKTKRLSAYDAEFERMKPIIHARSNGHCEAKRKILETVDEEHMSAAASAFFGIIVTVPCHPASCTHHRKLRKQGGSNSDVNLLDLCQRCHDLAHANPETAKELGLLLGAWDEER